MGAVATFSAATFKTRYPEFAGVEDGTLAAYFQEATIYFANDGSGPVFDQSVQLMLLNMLTAHIAARYAVVNGQIPSNLVGRINSAAEGSVNVAADFASTTPGTQAWFFQTKYGADFWQATAQFRTMKYRVAVGTIYGPGGFAMRRGFGW